MLDTISMAESLRGEYKEMFEQADVYGSTVSLSLSEKEDKLMELYDLLTEAQAEERPIEKLVGKDRELFCKSLFDEGGRKRGLSFWADQLLVPMGCLLVVSLIDLLFMEPESDLKPLMIGLAAGALVNSAAKYWIQPLVFQKKIKPIVFYLLTIAGVLLTIAGLFALTSGLAIPIPPLWILGISGAYVFLYLVGKWSRKDGRKQLAGKRETTKMIKEFNRELSQNNLFLPTVEGMEIRFRRYQKRRNRKGEEYTFEEFAEKIRKEESQQGLLKMGAAVFMVIVVVAGGISNGETLMESLLFMGILGFVEYWVWKTFMKSTHKSLRLQVEIIEACEEKGIGILEYLEEIREG